jgi:hypothetical protein
MATQEQLEQALRNAAAKARSGDERAATAARRFAAELKAMRQPRQSKTVEELTPGLSTNPTAGNSFAQNALIGIGKSFADTGRGLAQLAGRGPSMQEVDAIRQLEAPLMQTGGGVVGNIAGQLAQAAVPVGGGARLASYAGRAAPFISAAARGAAFAGAQNVGTEESRLANTAAGGALGAAGQGIASGAARLAQKAKAAVNPEILRSIGLARDAGIPLNAAQVTTSAPIRIAQAVSRNLPLSGAASSANAQQQAFNRAVARSFGADAPVLGDDVMRGARRALGSQFDDIYSRNTVEITPEVARRMAQIEAEAARDLTGEQAGIVSRQFQRILDDAADGPMTGERYKSLRAALKKLEDGGNTGSRVKELRQALDDAAAQSVGPDDAARLAKIRGQYANLRVAEDSLKQVSGAAGNIRPASLFPLLRNGSTREMRDLAKIGQNVLKDVVPDSGSAQRLFFQNLLTGGIAAPAAMAAGLGQAALGGVAVGRALNSNAASRLLQQGRPTAALSRLVTPAPRVLPLAYPAAAPAFNIGTVYGIDPEDPRYRGD